MGLTTIWRDRDSIGEIWLMRVRLLRAPGVNKLKAQLQRGNSTVSKSKLQYYIDMVPVFEAREI